jgi:predicted RNA binding protein YcfA (HicA-like mRNA interferase family)
MIAIIEQDGWQLRGLTGIHRQYVHAVKPGKVTIPGRPSAELHPTLSDGAGRLRRDTATAGGVDASTASNLASARRATATTV